MKLKLFSVLALSGLIATGVACGDSETDGEGGEGGSGGETTATTGTKGGTTTKTTGASPNTTSSTGGQMACEDIGSCTGDGMDPSSGCLECAVLGDDTIASDGGECGDEYLACYGTDENCTGASDPECCQVVDCINACDANMNNMIESGAELDCLCTNNGTQCEQTQMAGTCLGDYPSGIQTLFAYEDCAFGPDGMSGACGSVCQ